MVGEQPVSRTDHESVTQLRSPEQMFDRVLIASGSDFIGRTM